ncbi:MAG TPA: MarR family transcriptional regulator [Polyangiaceae bacterium]|jgi:DNA-binding MarR family transcriptional regulator|nr:MarR family transcriptional regulator [Polyangiaceae bacterium]
MAKPKDPLLLAEEIHRLVGRTRRRLWLATSRRLEDHGESPFRWHVVCYLVRNGATTQAELAYATAQHPAGVSRLVEELQEHGLVTREQDAADRRKVLVTVTSKGKAWFQSHAPAVNAAALEAMSHLSQSERSELRALLKKLLDEE